MLKKMSLVIIFSCIFLCACSSNKKEIEIGTDIAFVKEQFPEIDDIEEVKYYYNVKSNNREIGLQDIEFCGFIKIGEEFYEKITEEYEWKETKKVKRNCPKQYLWKERMKNIILHIIMIFLMMENIKHIHGAVLFI